jgi:hypothetical protein
MTTPFMKFITICFALVVSVVAASAQTAVNCPTFNTTEFTTGGAVVLANCQANSGMYGTISVAATGEVTCGPFSDAEFKLYAGVGTSPYSSPGANFYGQISGGILIVTSLVTPTTFNISTGQTLFDANSGSSIPNSASGSTLTITGQIDGPPGGVGHYSVSDSSPTVGNELMWALNVTPVLEGPPNSIQLSRPLEHLACQNGTTSVVTMTGSVAVGTFVETRLNLWVALVLTSESLSGRNPQSASWNNGQITIVVLSGLRGEIVQ